MAIRTNYKAHEKVYEDILKLYDLAEDLVKAVLDKKVADQKLALSLVENVTDQLVESTEVLTEHYILHVESGNELGPNQKEKTENAIRKVFLALMDFGKRVEDILLPKIKIPQGKEGIRAYLESLWKEVKAKFGDAYNKIFEIMILVGDYLAKLTRQIQQAGLGIDANQIFATLKSGVTTASVATLAQAAQTVETFGQSLTSGWSVGH